MKPIIFSSLLRAMLAGCAGMGDVDKGSRKGIYSAESFGAQRQAAVRWPQDQWWERYEDPMLNQLIAQALQHSPDLGMAQARLAQAAALADQVQAERGPQLDATGSVQRKRFAQEYDAGPPLAGSYGTTGVVSAQIHHNFDFWGGQRAAFQAALGEAAAREAEVHEARLLLASRLAEGWFELARLVEAQGQAEQALALREQTVQIVEHRRQAGLDTDVEYRQAQADVASSRRDISSLLEQARLQRHALAALAGLPVDALSDAAPILTTMRADEAPLLVPAQLVGRRPDIVAARWRVEAASQSAQAAKADFYPNISLRAFAGLARRGLSLGLGDWLIAGSRHYGVEPAISLPIFDAGRLRARLKTRSAELDAAVESYNRALLNAVRDVADQLVSLDSLAPQQQAQQETLDARQAAFDLARRQYERGLSNYLTVLNAQDALLQERRRSLDLKVRSAALGVELIRALGGGFDATNDVAGEKE